MISTGHYQEIVESLDERDEAIRRHNEQRQNQKLAQLDSGERIARLNRWPLETQIEHQRQQILRALEALHRGNHDDAKRILEAM